MKMLKQMLMFMTMVFFAQMSLAQGAGTEAKADKMAEKLQETQASLAITPAQMGAWNEYKAAVLNRSSTLSQEKMKIRAAREGVEVSQLEPKPPKAKKGNKTPKVYANTALARFDQQINFEKLNIQTLETQKSAFTKLYASLTPAQKEQVDKALKIK